MIKTAGARHIGSYHIDKYMPCQDAVYYDSGEIGVIAISDGAGSIPNSERYSEFAVESLSKFVKEHFDELWNSRKNDISLLFLNYAKNAFQGSELYPEFAYCTFLLFAASADGRWLALHVGDGGIFVNFSDSMEVLSHPENGLDSSETFFLKSCFANTEESSSHLRVYKGENSVIQVLMTSDGCWNSLYEYERSNAAKAVGIISKWLELNDETKVSEAIEKQLATLFFEQSSDDLSIACLYKENNDYDKQIPGEDTGCDS